MAESEDPKLTVRRLAAAAGISIPEERVQILAESLPLVGQVVEALAALDLSDTEPALIFRPPAPERPP